MLEVRAISYGVRFLFPESQPAGRGAGPPFPRPGSLAREGGAYLPLEERPPGRLRPLVGVPAPGGRRGRRGAGAMMGAG